MTFADLSRVISQFVSTVTVTVNTAAVVTTMTARSSHSHNLLARRTLTMYTTARVATWATNISLGNSLRATAYARIATARVTT